MYCKILRFKVSSGFMPSVQLSLFGIVTRLRVGQSRKCGPVLSTGRDISVLIRIQGQFGVHPASYSMCTEVAFPGSKAAME